MAIAVDIDRKENLREDRAMSTSQTNHRWRDRAACRGMDPTLFFPGQGESVTEAQAVCSACAVQVECGGYALDSGQRFGIWGGTTERRRRQLRAEHRHLDQGVSAA